MSVFILLVVNWVDYRGYFAALNAPILDLILRTRSTGGESAAAKAMAVIEIDDQAYKQCFHNTSPMNPGTVFDLVTAIANLNPKTIGVDIRTEGEEYTKLRENLDRYASSIVWVSAFENPRAYVPSFPSWLLGDLDTNTVTPLRVLGTSPFRLTDSRQTNWGVPLYPREDDGQVRRFPRTVRLAATDVQGGGIAPSWASRVADVYCSPECMAESADEIYVSYAVTAPHEYTMSSLFTCENDSNAQNTVRLKRKPSFAKLEIRGKVVLIGGTFGLSGDSYPTPLGTRSGLLVNAYAVKASLDGNGFEQLRQPLAWMLDLLLGLSIIYLFDEKALKKLKWIDGLIGLLKGPKRKEIVFSTALVLMVCALSLKVAHGRYLLGFAGEGVGVIIDRLRNLWEYSREKTHHSDLAVH